MLYDIKLRGVFSMNKKTVISAILGAVSGATVTALIAVSSVGYVELDSDKMPNKDAGAVISQNEIAKENITEAENILSVTAGSGKEALSVEEIAKRVGPSIVGISCKTVVQSYFGAQSSQSSGSGIIIDDKGHIVTNYHVIEGASSLKVKLNSGNEYDATVVGGDEKTDIAVIKIESKEELRVATIGNSDEVEVGSLAVAIGNPLASELFGTVTAGVISGVNRTITVGQRDMNLIQTDAAISPGNSGGALINKYGEVIGINSVKLIDDAAEGLGFAIPMNEAVPIMQDLMKHGYVKGRPIIGVTVREITSELAYYNNLLVEEGLYVISVTEDSAAANAGIVRGDIIIKFDGEKITSSAQLNKIRDKHKAGDSVSMTFMRGTQEKTVNITLTEDLTNKKK